MSKIKIARRGKPLAIGLLRTAPFIAAGVLSMVFFYSSNSQTFDWERDSIIFLIFSLLCTTVFFAVSQQLPYSKKNIIDDLLISSLYHLGAKFGINIMELNSSEHNAFDSFFKITYGHGYKDPSTEHAKTTAHLPDISYQQIEKKVAT